MKLRSYQEKFVLNISRSLVKNKRVIGQLATGGGKSICFASICDRYVKKSGKSVLILVHRKELLKQAKNTLHKAYGLNAQVIVAGMRTIPDAPVYVGMVESTFRRLDKLKNIGLLIIDEAHLASFNKIIDHYSDILIIGFTATPLASNKTKPLKNYFESIVCGIDIPDLIKEGNLCQNITYAPKETVNRSELNVVRGEFDDNQMGIEFSKPKHVNNTIAAYERFSLGQKTIIFNVNISHSKLVCENFIDKGYNCRHLDGESTDRDEILQWFDATPDAILCNIGIATTGFDQPDIETVIVNKATQSMPLWLQMTGRGGRPHDIKKMFTIIDMGGNIVVHGDWCAPRDWEDIFYNPPKKGDGVAPVKECPECGAFLHARKMICEIIIDGVDAGCGYIFPEKQLEEAESIDFMVATQGIDIESLIENNRMYKDYYTFYKIGTELAYQAKNVISKMNDEQFYFILDRYHEIGRQWCKHHKKKYNQWHRDLAESHLIQEIEKNFKSWKKS